jgi:hypothetical protein
VINNAKKNTRGAKMIEKRFPLKSVKVETCKSCPALIGTKTTNFGCSWGVVYRDIDDVNMIPEWCPLANWQVDLYLNKTIIAEDIDRDYSKA